MALSSFFLIIKKLEFLFVFKLYFRFKGHLVRKIKLPVHKINLKKISNRKIKVKNAFQLKRIKNKKQAKLGSTFFFICSFQNNTSNFCNWFSGILSKISIIHIKLDYVSKNPKNRQWFFLLQVGLPKFSAQEIHGIWEQRLREHSPLSFSSPESKKSLKKEPSIEI